ncbi:receptor expression-enhancing protein 1 isoform X9 [Anser cygnoides]|uniref:receptor expression-enhancing protein 1 isoform X9 n=1 Tax=Anser cygnoides TaxID=8845 RepID=UPI0034D30F33
MSCEALPAPRASSGAAPQAVRLIFGTLYPAYYSYKAVKSKDIKEYVKWMMYWIIFALFTTAETFTDIFLCWFPFYYELKIAFVAWLLSPYTKGSSLLYRKFVHPTLSSKEKEIDDCLVQAKDRSYDALVHFGKRGLNVAATAAVMAASKVSQLLHLHLYLDQKKGQVDPVCCALKASPCSHQQNAFQVLCWQSEGCQQPGGELCLWKTHLTQVVATVVAELPCLLLFSHWWAKGSLALPLLRSH